MNTLQNPARSFVILAVIVVLALVAYSILVSPDRRSTTEKVGDAIHELPQGLDKAGRQLGDRTPGERLGDAIKDTGDKVKRNTE